MDHKPGRICSTGGRTFSTQARHWAGAASPKSKSKAAVAPRSLMSFDEVLVELAGSLLTTSRPRREIPLVVAGEHWRPVARTGPCTSECRATRYADRRSEELPGRD